MAFLFKQNKKLKNGTRLQQKLYSQPFEATETGYINKESPYPWYRQKIFGPCPFPRYGHASNSTVSKTGDIYIFGGLVKEKVKHDLWIIDSATMMSYQVQTPGDCPSSRVGHAGLVIGNAFIVFGGDTKTSKNNVNDNSLYLLNTTSKIWTKALVHGNKPSGRYGHTLNILGTKIVVFGGQMEASFFNDMFLFDLDALNTLNAKWELITPVTALPSPRTNHIMITYQEKLYLFGGTNGTQWFNDVWVFDYKNFSWKEIACNGCIPQPREGHSAALVDDIIYIFGGRGSDGSDLGDLIAFKISTSRWFIFQNMGSSPSPRSGHVLTSFGQKIIVLGGEGSLNKIEDSSISYILDTSKIRYPPEISIPNLASSPMIKSGSLLAPSPLLPIPQKALSMSSSKLNQGPKSPLSITTPSKLLQHSESLRTDMQTMSLEQFHKQRISRKNNRSKDLSTSYKEEPNSIHHSNSVNNLRISRSQSQDQIKKIMVSDIKLSTSQTNSNNQNETKSALTTDENQVQDIELIKEKNLNADNLQANNKDVQNLKFKENMDELKVKNELLQAELDLIKNTDLEKSSTEVFFDSIERQNMIENLISLKKQITLLKLEILSQTKAASLKIAEAEAEKNNCLQEAAYYKAKLAALSTPEILSTVENARISELSTKLSNAIASRQELNEKLTSLSEDIELEQRKVQQLEDMNQNYLKRIKVAESAHERISIELNETRLACINAEEEVKEQISLKNNLECEKNQLSQENITLKQELEDLKEKNMLFLKSIEMINISVTMAENRVSNSESRSQKDQEARVELQNKVNQLTRELMLESNKKQALEEKIANLESKILNITKEASVAREIMNEGILELLKKSREESSNNSSNDNQVKMLQEQLTSVKSLYSALQVSANKSVKDLVTALEKISQLETLNFSSNREIQDLRDKMIDLLKELDALKKDHRNMKNLLTTKDKDLEIAHMKASAISRLLEEYPLLEEQKISKNDAASCITRGTSMTPDALDKDNFKTLIGELEQNDHIKQGIKKSEGLNASSLPDTENKTLNDEDIEDDSKSHKDTLPNNMSLVNLEKEALELERQKVIDAERRLEESTQNFKERLQQLEGDYQSAVFYMKSTENMLKRMKEELSKYKIQNFHLKQENDNLKNYKNMAILNFKDHKIHDNETQNNSLSHDYAETQAHQDILLQEKELESLEEKYINLKNTYHEDNKDSADTVFPELEKTIDLETVPKDGNLVFEYLSNDQLVFSDKISKEDKNIPNLEELGNANDYIIDSVENDSIFLKEPEQLLPIDHYNIHENTSSDSNNTTKDATFKESVFSRTSDTLDSLANELDKLRTQWESTHKDYETLLSD